VTAEADEAAQRLAVAAQSGDRRAFEQLVRLHKASLYRFVRRYVGDADDAYDLVQDAFVSAWLALRRFDARQSFAAWLRAIALNKCRDFGRRRAVRRRLLVLFAGDFSRAQDTDSPGEEDPEPHAQVRLRRLDQAIAALPRLYKEPLLLTLVSGLTQQQAAGELGVSTKAVELRIRRAKRTLARILGEPADDFPPEG
jgi:RNA polymerase sigma-70 factor (ECF subfamily)